MNWEIIANQLLDFLKTEVKKAGFKSVVFGLSGGLDSALVAVLCKKAFGENALAIMMPSQFSSASSVEDAKILCEKFDIAYEIIPVSPMISSYLENMQDDKLRIGNFSARARMSVLYDISARQKSLVIGTSNKSELLLGYGTIFGDIACALNPIGEIYKSDEYAFAKYLDVPECILNKKPSADLYEGQNDEDELGFSYKQIDALAKKLVDEKKSRQELINLGFDKDMIDTIENKIKINAFKGKLPKIAKINWSKK